MTLKVLEPGLLVVNDAAGHAIRRIQTLKIVVMAEEVAHQVEDETEITRREVDAEDRLVTRVMKTDDLKKCEEIENDAHVISKEDLEVHPFRKWKHFPGSRDPGIPSISSFATSLKPAVGNELPKEID